MPPFSSNLIAEKWFAYTKNIPSKTLIFIKLIGIGVPIQLLSSLYYGGTGLNRQVQNQLISNSVEYCKEAPLVIILFIVLGKIHLQILFI